MSRILIRGSRRLLLVATLALSTCYVERINASQGRLSLAQLADACQKVASDFRPLTQEDLDTARTRLLEASKRLDARLRAAGANGLRWRKYLKWDRMQQQLRPGHAPDLDVLHDICRRYEADHQGLKLVCFADVRDGLRQYRLIARDLQSGQTRARFERILAGLPAYLEAYRREPTTDLALAIGNALQWLTRRGQVPQLVDTLRGELSHPNLLFDVSGHLIDILLAGRAADKSPVRDVILGTQLYGTGDTTGRVRTQLVPNSRRGAFDTFFAGTSKTQTVGYNGPVSIRSSGLTQLTGRVRIWVDAEGLSFDPARSDGETHSRIHGISARRGSRIVECLAWRRATRQKCLAEQIAAEHAEDRLNRRMDDDTRRLVDRINTVYRTKIRQPLLARRLFPQQVTFATTQQAIAVAVLQADESQLGAPGEPPAATPPWDLAVRIHESMVNNLAAAALGGAALSEERVLEMLRRLGASQALLDSVRSMEGEPSWKIAFAPVRPSSGEQTLPISVRFAGGELSVTVRGNEYYRGSSPYSATDIGARYRIEQTDQGLALVRQGEILATRPGGGFTPHRAVFQRRFAGVFRERFVLQPLKLEVGGRGGALRRRIIQLDPVHCACDGGWLALAWRVHPSEEPSH